MDRMLLVWVYFVLLQVRRQQTESKNCRALMGQQSSKRGIKSGKAKHDEHSVGIYVTDDSNEDVDNLSLPTYGVGEIDIHYLVASAVFLTFLKTRDQHRHVT